MAITASAVAGTKARSPRARRPAFSGVAPSTSLAGSISSSTAGASRWAGTGWATTMPAMLGSRFRAPMRAARSESCTPSGGTISKASRCPRCAPRAPDAGGVDRRRAALVEAHDRQARRVAPALLQRLRRGPRARATGARRPPGRRGSSRSRRHDPPVDDGQGGALRPSAAWRSSRSASRRGRFAQGCVRRQVGEVDAHVEDGAAQPTRWPAGPPTPASLTAFGLPIGAIRWARSSTSAATSAVRSGTSAAATMARPSSALRAARLLIGFLGEASRRDHRRRRRRRPARPGAAAARAAPRASSRSSRSVCSWGAASGRPMVSSATIATSAAPMAPASAAAEPPPGIGSRLARRAVSSLKGRPVRSVVCVSPARGSGGQWAPLVEARGADCTG